MSHKKTQFKISELRQRSLERTAEAIMIIFASIIAIAILPSLLLRYMYDPTQLLEQPKLLEYIPVVAVLIATFYLIRALVGNMKREKEARHLMMELEVSDDCCGNGGSCCSGSDDNEDEDWDEDLKELEELLAEVEEEEKAEKKKPKKKATKKSSKK